MTLDETAQPGECAMELVYTPVYTAKQTVEQRVHCVPARTACQASQTVDACPSRVWVSLSKGRSRFLIVYSSPVVTTSKRRLETNEPLGYGWLFAEVSHLDRSGCRPKQKPAILCSEERRLRTRNIRNIHNLFI